MRMGAPPAAPGRGHTDGFEIFPQAVFDVYGQLMLETTYTPGQQGNPMKTTNGGPSGRRSGANKNRTCDLILIRDAL